MPESNIMIVLVKSRLVMSPHGGDSTDMTDTDTDTDYDRPKQ